MQGQGKQSDHSDELGTHISHKKKHLDQLFGDRRVEREIKVTKVFQDNPIQEVFCDSYDVYYAMTRLPQL